MNNPINVLEKTYQELQPLRNFRLSLSLIRFLYFSHGLIKRLFLCFSYILQFSVLHLCFCQNHVFLLFIIFPFLWFKRTHTDNGILYRIQPTNNPEPLLSPISPTQPYKIWAVKLEVHINPVVGQYNRGTKSIYSCTVEQYLTLAQPTASGLGARTVRTAVERFYSSDPVGPPWQWPLFVLLGSLGATTTVPLAASTPAELATWRGQQQWL